MSANPGKVQVLGVSEVRGEGHRAALHPGCDPDWVHRPFFTRYHEKATRLSELRPTFDENAFFFEEGLEEFYRENLQTAHAEDYE